MIKDIIMFSFSKNLYITLLIILLNPLTLLSDSLIEEQKQGWESVVNELKNNPQAITSMSTKEFLKVFGRYGNWTGPGLSGGLEDPVKIGSKPPLDSLDEASMRHDFAYAIAEQQGAAFGADEEQRLKSLADKILLKELRNLNKGKNKIQKIGIIHLQI